MAKFRIEASYRVHLKATIEADTLEGAQAIAHDLDGGEFEQLSDRGLDDWAIDEVYAA